MLAMVKDDIMPMSTNFASPYAMGFPDCGNSIAAMTGAVVSDFLNQVKSLGVVVETVFFPKKELKFTENYPCSFRSKIGDHRLANSFLEVSQEKFQD